MKAFSAYDPSLARPFIEKWEGCRLTAYVCPAGIWTIGIGHTGDVKAGGTVTPDEAAQLFDDDCRAVIQQLAPYVNVPVTEGQFIALLSLAFNVGAGYVVHNCPRLMRALNAGDVEACAHEFLDINRAGGKVLAGLTERRRAEAKLFLSEA